MSEGIEIPITSRQDDTVRIAMEEVTKSLNSVQRAMLEASIQAESSAGKWVEFGRAMGGRDQVEIRAAMIRQLEELHGKLPQTAEELRKTAEAAKDSGLKFTELWSAVSLVKEAFAWTREAVERLVELSAEEEHLTRNSARLGLDFDAAAGGAGRFVDEVQVMTAANRFAEAGLRLTQEEMGQVTRRAAILSQNLGIDTTQAFNVLYQAIENGNLRSLRPLGEHMTELAGRTHTAAERLHALVTETEGMASATDDAASSMERWKDNIEDAQRAFAAAFTSEASGLQRALDQIDQGRESTLDWTTAMRALGGAMAYTAQVVKTAFIGMADTLRVILAGAVQPFYNIVAAVTQLARRDLAGARLAFFDTSFTRDVVRDLRTDVNQMHALVSGDAERASAAANDNDRPGQLAGRNASGMEFSPQEVAAADRESARNARRGASAANRANQEWLRELENNVREHPDQVRGFTGELSDAVDADLSRRFGQAAERITDRLNRQLRESLNRSTAALMQTAELRPHRVSGGFEQPEERLSLSDLEAMQRDEAERAGPAEMGRRQDEMRQRLDPEGARRDSEDRNRAFQQRQAQARVQQEHSLTDQLQRQFQIRATAAQSMAESVRGSYESMTKAFGTHLAAVIQGKESLGEALEAALSQTLTTLSTEATTKALMQVAEAIASAAMYDYAAAGEHLAAAAAYGAVAVAAGLGAAATTPSAAGVGAGGSAASQGRASLPANDTGRGQQDRGPANVTIIYGSGVMSTPRDLARHVGQVLQTAHVQGRFQLDGRVVRQRAA